MENMNNAAAIINEWNSLATQAQINFITACTFKIIKAQPTGTRQEINEIVNEAWLRITDNMTADRLTVINERRTAQGKTPTTVDKTPLNTPANTTILSSKRLNGETAYTIYSGGTTREKFLDYLKNTLIPTLHEGDIVIMDNMRTHHVKEVQTLLQGAGMKLLYLPAYSPDLNPIENMWSKIKAILRKLKIRLLPMLPHGIAEAFSRIRPSDCTGWFSAAGVPC